MYNTAMKKTMIITMVIMLILGAAACGQSAYEVQEAVPTTAVTQAPTPTQAPTTSPTQVPTTVPTTSPTQVPTATPVPTPNYEIIGQVMSTAEEFVNIREAATTDSEIVGQFSSGDLADVIEFLGGWVHIVYGDAVGYVSADYTVRVYKPDVPVPSGEWTMILVNPTNLLPEDFVVELADFEDGQVDERILAIAEQMFADAKNDGVDLMLVDAYRSEVTQSGYFEKKVQQYIDQGYSREDAEEKAATITARPNTSEHQTGLTMDIVTPSRTRRNSGFADTDAFKWLYANAHNYGFTLRYKKGKESITKVIYEPWHWRFVGVEAATQMRASGQVFEEYLGILD